MCVAPILFLVCVRMSKRLKKQHLRRSSKSCFPNWLVTGRIKRMCHYSHRYSQLQGTRRGEAAGQQPSLSYSGCCSQSALPRLGWVTHTHFLFLLKASAAAFFLTWQQSTCVGLCVFVCVEGNNDLILLLFYISDRLTIIRNQIQ